MSRTTWKLSRREQEALASEAGRNAYSAAKLAGKDETEARAAALEAWEGRCRVCGRYPAVRCCEFGAAS